jgi:hypothetical protein
MFIKLGFLHNFNIVNLSNGYNSYDSLICECTQYWICQSTIDFILITWLWTHKYTTIFWNNTFNVNNEVWNSKMWIGWLSKLSRN